MNEEGSQPEIIRLSKEDDGRFQKAQLIWKIADYRKTLAYSKAAGEKCIHSRAYIITIPTENPSQPHSKLGFSLKINWQDNKDKSLSGEEEEEEDGGQGEDESDGADNREKSIGMFLHFWPKWSSSPEVV